MQFDKVIVLQEKRVAQVFTSCFGPRRKKSQVKSTR